MTTFENYTGASVKDCFFRDKELVFIVKEGQLGKAIGKGGVNIRNLVLKLKYKVRVIGFDNDPVVFLKNLLYPVEGYEAEREDDKIVIKAKDNKVRGKIYGRDRSNLAWIKEVLKRHFKGIEVVME